MQSALRGLVDESVTIIREVAAEFERPVMLFSGGKDSVVMLHLAVRAFAPARVPFPVMHIDTGHNFPEVIEFRDRAVAELDVQLIVSSVQASIDAGRMQDATGPRASRNPLQTVTLLDSITEHKFDAVFGGATCMCMDNAAMYPDWMNMTGISTQRSNLCVQQRECQDEAWAEAWVHDCQYSWTAWTECLPADGEPMCGNGTTSRTYRPLSDQPSVCTEYEVQTMPCNVSCPAPARVPGSFYFSY